MAPVSGARHGPKRTAWTSMIGCFLLCRKRTCRVDLGGHCATENAIAVADSWHYLNSHLSPGRRRGRRYQLP